MIILITISTYFKNHNAFINFFYFIENVELFVIKQRKKAKAAS